MDMDEPATNANEIQHPDGERDHNRGQADQVVPRQNKLEATARKMGVAKEATSTMRTIGSTRTSSTVNAFGMTTRAATKTPLASAPSSLFLLLLDLQLC